MNTWMKRAEDAQLRAEAYRVAHAETKDELLKTMAVYANERESFRLRLAQAFKTGANIGLDTLVDYACEHSQTFSKVVDILCGDGKYGNIVDAAKARVEQARLTLAALEKHLGHPVEDLGQALQRVIVYADFYNQCMERLDERDPAVALDELLRLIDASRRAKSAVAAVKPSDPSAFWPASYRPRLDMWTKLGWSALPEGTTLVDGDRGWYAHPGEEYNKTWSGDRGGLLVGSKVSGNPQLGVRINLPAWVPDGWRSTLAKGSIEKRFRVRPDGEHIQKDDRWAWVAVDKGPPDFADMMVSRLDEPASRAGKCWRDGDRLLVLQPVSV